MTSPLTSVLQGCGGNGTDLHGPPDVATGAQRSSAPGANDDASLLAIVSSQRDRFRARNVELEAEARHQAQSMVSLRNEVDGLRADNIKLYEKIKFVQGYQASATTHRTTDDAVNKYSSQYEEHINPFTAFSAKEKQRKYTSMNPADKLVHTVSRIVLASSRARLVFVGYIIFLHVLIFLVLVRFSHNTSTTAGVHEQCMKKYANHMHAIHHEELFDMGDQQQ